MSSTTKFTVEVRTPSKEEILAVACPFCKVPVGSKCQTPGWYGRHAPKPIKTLHHDRVAVAAGLEIVVSSSVYRIKK
jgi:hypothetical protein